MGSQQRSERSNPMQSLLYFQGRRGDKSLPKVIQSAGLLRILPALSGSTFTITLSTEITALTYFYPPPSSGLDVVLYVLLHLLRQRKAPSYYSRSLHHGIVRMEQSGRPRAVYTELFLDFQDSVQRFIPRTMNFWHYTGHGRVYVHLEFKHVFLFLLHPNFQTCSLNQRTFLHLSSRKAWGPITETTRTTSFWHILMIQSS